MDREDKLVVCRKHPCAYIFPVLYICLIVREIVVFKGDIIVDAINGDRGDMWMLIIALLAILYIVISYLTNYLILTPTEIYGQKGFIFYDKYYEPISHVESTPLVYTPLGMVLGYRKINIMLWGKQEPDFSMGHMMNGRKFARTFNSLKY